MGAHTVRQAPAGRLIRSFFPTQVLKAISIILLLGMTSVRTFAAADGPAGPFVAAGQTANWWFVFKFNGKAFPACGGAQRNCAFGGDPGNWTGWGQQFAYASDTNSTLQKGAGCVGDTTADPVGATFAAIYNGALHFVIWNDQFQGDPGLTNCPASNGDCEGPSAHAKGAVAWNDSGEGFVMKVTTPAWPVAGRKGVERGQNGNTLGCTADNNVKFSQHFFALKLSKDDLLIVLKALGNASVATDPNDSQVVNNGGPPDVQAAVSALGPQIKTKNATMDTLSSGVRVISKPSALHVPPWQMVSSVLGGIGLRTANWSLVKPGIIHSTSAETQIGCWDAGLITPPGPVEIATSGSFNGTTFDLRGEIGNHAKIGISKDEGSTLSIFGDMNQQGALSKADGGAKGCASSQDGRGGLFFVVDDKGLHDSVQQLIAGGTDPVQ